MGTVPIELHANDTADSSLAGALGGAVGDTTFTVLTGHGSRFPAPAAGQQFRVRLLNRDVNGNVLSSELVKVTGRTGDVFTVERGIEGYARVAHAIGTRVSAVHSRVQAVRAHPGYSYHPRQNNLLAVTFDTDMGQRSVRMQPPVGRVIWVRMPAPEDLPLAFFKTFIELAGAGLTNCFAGSYNKAGVLLGKTADQSAVWNSTGVKADQALDVVPSLVPGGEDEIFYGAVLVGAATTSPGFVTTNAHSGLRNIGLTVGTHYPRLAISVATGLTALPASVNFLSGSAVGLGQNDVPWFAFG